MTITCARARAHFRQDENYECSLDCAREVGRFLELCACFFILRLLDGNGYVKLCCVTVFGRIDTDVRGELHAACNRRSTKPAPSRPRRARRNHGAAATRKRGRSTSGPSNFPSAKPPSVGSLLLCVAATCAGSCSKAVLLPAKFPRTSRRGAWPSHLPEVVSQGKGRDAYGGSFATAATAAIKEGQEAPAAADWRNFSSTCRCGQEGSQTLKAASSNVEGPPTHLPSGTLVPGPAVCGPAVKDASPDFQDDTPPDFSVAPDAHRVVLQVHGAPGGQRTGDDRARRVGHADADTEDGFDGLVRVPPLQAHGVRQNGCLGEGGREEVSAQPWLRSFAAELGSSAASLIGFGDLSSIWERVGRLGGASSRTQDADLHHPYVRHDDAGEWAHKFDGLSSRTLEPEGCCARWHT
mmetsp:Transcript_6926/g.15148  ORF Transcript_6926/g.15148 Transcript_6926/m.15148 type:complete len:409 (-) Transcript_6926:296-1522(-)